ncbi:MAG: hypothetical protein JSS65_00710 [Armatimonadetes bacterium]|nr:hypothetical protein [Armatimonadota bacterium]
MLSPFVCLIAFSTPKSLTGHAGALVGDATYITGGMQLVNEGRYFGELWKIDCNTKTWQTLPGPKTPRGMAAMASVGDRLVLVGGLRWPDTALASAESFDLMSKRWTDLSPLLQARSRFALIAVGNTVFALGGLGDRGNLDSIESFDFKSRAWKTVGKLSLPRHGLAAAAMGGKIYVAGGFTEDRTTARFEVFDPVTGHTTVLPDMPGPRGFFALVPFGNGLLAVGGRQSDAKSMFYDPKTRLWSPLTKPDLDRNRFVAFVRQNKLWVIGGESRDSVPVLDSLDIRK